MKRVYCSKCNKETFMDIADDVRNKSNKCTVHPADDEDAENKMKNQLKKKTLLTKSRPTTEGVTWVVTYSRTSTMEAKTLYPERHGPFCE